MTGALSDAPARELCQPPNPAPRQPQLVCPPGSTDCHVHVYGPYDVYPPAPTRTFDVPPASPSELRALLDRLGVDRAVLVQPSGYGTDNRRHMEAAREIGRPARVVVALRADTPDKVLDELHEGGARGVRFTIGHRGTVPLEDMSVLAPRVAARGWHVQLHVFDGAHAALAEMEPLLRSIPSDLVIDHMGSLVPRLGLAQPGFQALLRLTRSGRTWVKLSCGYRMSAEAPPYLDMVPYVRALLAERPDRLLWASDWPHVLFKGKMPNTTDLLDQMLRWVPDEVERKRILVDNPTRLYGF